MAGVGPQVVQVLDFATARAPELQALHELAHHVSIASAADAKLISQRNQRRRRANAFKAHSMPRRLRMPNASTAPPPQEEEHIALGNNRGGRFKVMASSSAAAAAGLVSAAIVKDKVAKVRAKRESKPRCRKHRRRMHLLLEERSWPAIKTVDQADDDDNEGQRHDGAAVLQAPKWLSTHAWHAKRMLMTERYGHVLAQHRQDKGVSAALAALRKTATLHDMSYYGVLELYGLDELILEALQLVSDPSGSEFEDRTFLSGKQEGNSVLYHPHQFPLGAIAPVSFTWRPVASNDNSVEEDDAPPLLRKRQLWLWIHPAAFMEAATAIAGACQDVMSERDGAESIEVLDRRGHVSRLQLRGKGADAMLKSLLKPAHRGQVLVEEAAAPHSDHEDGFSSSTVRDFMASSRNWSAFQRMLDASAQRHSTDGHVVSLLLQDPRTNGMSSQEDQRGRHAKLSLLDEPSSELVDAASDIVCPLSGVSLTSDNKEEPDSELILLQLQSLLQWASGSTRTDLPSESTYPYTSPPCTSAASDIDMLGTEYPSDEPATACSALWSLSGREQVRRTFLKNHEMNRSRGGPMANDVPVVLVRQNLPFPDTSGWDLIHSPEYAPAFLNALVFCGAMVIGLDELEAVATVVHAPSFPRDFPDTAAGQAYWEQHAGTQENVYAKKPKPKRINYEKLGVDSPFQPNWDLLFKDQSQAAEDRVHTTEDDEDEDMKAPQTLCVLRSASYMEPFPFFSFVDHNNDESSMAVEGVDEPKELVPVAVPTLIRVTLSIPRRGNLEPCSLLYIPTVEDIENFHNDVKWNGRQFENATSAEREIELFGFVTSAVYDRPKSAFRGTAFCACEPLQHLAISLQNHAETTLLALVRAPSSRQLRPVLLHIQA